jgi:hypothetical protein
MLLHLTHIAQIGHCCCHVTVFIDPWLIGSLRENLLYSKSLTILNRNRRRGREGEMKRS